MLGQMIENYFLPVGMVALIKTLSSSYTLKGYPLQDQHQLFTP